MQIKKILPGLVLGVVFVAAFIVGINSFSGTTASSKATLTQPTPAGSSLLYNDPAPATTEVPTVASTPVPVISQPADVDNQTVQAAPVVTTAQPAPNTKAQENHKSKEQEHKSGEKHEEEEGDDD